MRILCLWFVMNSQVLLVSGSKRVLSLPVDGVCFNLLEVRLRSSLHNEKVKDGSGSICT